MESIGTIEHEYEVSEDRAVLEPGFRVLDERERKILQLRFFEGLTQSQIAQQIGISQMHVSRLIRRSLEKIREEIASDGAAKSRRGGRRPPKRLWRNGARRQGRWSPPLESPHEDDRRAARGLPLLLRGEGPSALPVVLADPAR